MKNKIILLIERKISEVQNEMEPSYCGIEVYNEWLIEHNARLELLEEMKDEIATLEE